ncbi:exonuclease domain-containing protein [Nocardia sp. NPDC050793]|uniref:exonuclease domain-containing protein n=1 Tax=Nocardia sp. NPDC050793 TaxID=3155159 RepID=UPI0033F79DB7
MLNFTTIDFETANSYRGSPCSVGLVRVRDGKPVEDRHWLIRPPERAGHFDHFNVDLHRITADQVSNAPAWKEILPEIVDFISGDVVVAHNAGFDLGVIRDACVADQLPWPELRFLCSLVISRRALSLPSYRLPYVVESLGGIHPDQHDALADARAVADVVLRLATDRKASDLAELAGSVDVRFGRMVGGEYRGSVAISSGGGGARRLVQGELNPDADPNGYLYGRVVVFTGTLFSMGRNAAWQECAQLGATAEKDVTRRTNVLVVGDINPAVLRPGAELTGKARRAVDLQRAGQKIELMTEDDFLRCLADKPLDELRPTMSGR